MSIIEPGTVLQLTIAMIFSLIYTVICIQASPYKSLSDGYLAVCTSTCITLALVLCAIFKFNNLTQVDTVRAVMSYTQLKMYAPNEQALVVVMLASIFSTIGAGVLITWTNLRGEKRRAKTEDLKSKARRLRYGETMLSVQASALPTADHFHIFLSHVWGTGQDQSTHAAPQTTD